VEHRVRVPALERRKSGRGRFGQKGQGPLRLRSADDCGDVLACLSQNILVISPDGALASVSLGNVFEGGQVPGTGLPHQLCRLRRRTLVHQRESRQNDTVHAAFLDSLLWAGENRVSFSPAPSRRFIRFPGGTRHQTLPREIDEVFKTGFPCTLRFNKGCGCATNRNLSLFSKPAHLFILDAWRLDATQMNPIVYGRELRLAATFAADRLDRDRHLIGIAQT